MGGAVSFSCGGFSTNEEGGKTYGNVFGGSVCGGDEYNLKNWKKRAKMRVCERRFFAAETQREAEGGQGTGETIGEIFFSLI
jgi:hypothetical protein